MGNLQETVASLFFIKIQFLTKVIEFEERGGGTAQAFGWGSWEFCSNACLDLYQFCINNIHFKN